MLKPPPRRHAPTAEMNVVPYIDVVLVLLVIFMVTTPLLTQGVKIELPKVAAEALAPERERLIVTLTLSRDGVWHWHLGPELELEERSGSAADASTMSERVAALVAANGDTEVYLRADGGVDYTRVVAGIAALQQGGVRSLGLITEQP
jgi:biopolymer transport protein TolR